jgi:RimJ/RimL family protein N-acetyltransferase
MDFPDRFPILKTERLVLRETAEHDVDAVFAMESDPIAMRYWSRPPMRDISEARAAVERAMGYFREHVGLRWSIARPADDWMLGHLSLFNFSEQSARADIGYGLAREHWGQGFMHEALIAVVDYAFGPLGLRRLEADIDPRNQASLRALARPGFAHEGLLRERWQVGDEISDTAFMGLLAREWKDARRRGVIAGPRRVSASAVRQGAKARAGLERWRVASAGPRPAMSRAHHATNRDAGGVGSSVSSACSRFAARATSCPTAAARCPASERNLKFPRRVES